MVAEMQIPTMVRSIAEAKAHFSADCHSEKLLLGDLHEIRAFDPDLSAERNLARAGRFINGIVRQLHFPKAALPVVDDDLYGIDDGHPALCGTIKLFSYAPL